MNTETEKKSRKAGGRLPPTITWTEDGQFVQGHLVEIKSIDSKKYEGKKNSLYMFEVTKSNVVPVGAQCGVWGTGHLDWAWRQVNPQRGEEVKITFIGLSAPNEDKGDEPIKTFEVEVLE